MPISSSARAVHRRATWGSGRREFDLIVVDEFHHAAARTYRRIMEHFQPRFLLGLTGTPERLDAADLLALCNDNLVFECCIVEGIARGELCPFEYWAEKDVTDFAPIPWRNGRFDPVELSRALETEQTRRARSPSGDSGAVTVPWRSAAPSATRTT